MYNTYVLRRMTLRFFWAFLLSSVVYRVNCVVDGIIVSHSITPDAVSAIGLAAPITTLLLLFSEIVCNGGSIIAAKWIGALNYRDASRMSSVCLASMLLIYGLIAVVTFIFSEQIANFLTEEERLRVLLYDYLPISFISVCVLSVSTVFYKFIEAAGKPSLVTKSLVVLCISNILLDLLFVVVFGWGIKGAAWASLVSIFISNVVYIRFYTDRKCIYKPVLPKKKWAVSMFSSAFSMGFPTGVGSLSGAVLVAVLNAIALKVAGADGLFVLCAGLQMLLICSLLLESTKDIISNEGAILLGEKDIDSYRTAVVRTRQRSLITIGLLTVLMMAFPDFIARIFNASDQLIEYSRTPLRQVCLMFLPYSMLTLFSAGFQVQGHKTLASIFLAGKIVSILYAVWITLKLCPQDVWLSGFLGFSVLFICMSAITWPLSRRYPNLQPYTLINKYPEYPCICESVPYALDGIPPMLAEAQNFLERCNIPPSRSDNILLCIEKLSSDIVNMDFNAHRKGFFDVRLVNEKDVVLVVIKEVNRPYNPADTLGVNADTASEEEKSPFSAMIEDVRYQYLNGINCTYIKFRKDFLEENSEAKNLEK